MPFCTAIKTVLQADSEVVDDLATWDFGDGMEPSIHLMEPAPIEAPNPVCTIVTSGSGSEDASGGTRSVQAFDVPVTITIWEDKNRSDKRIRRLAWRIFEVLRTVPVQVEGWTVRNQRIATPQRTKDKEGYSGYVITASVEATILRS